MIEKKLMNCKYGVQFDKGQKYEENDIGFNYYQILDVLDIEQFSTVKGVNLDAKDDTFYQVNGYQNPSIYESL